MQSFTATVRLSFLHQEDDASTAPDLDGVGDPARASRGRWGPPASGDTGSVTADQWS